VLILKPKTQTTNTVCNKQKEGTTYKQ